jgi:hypothetical protein
MADSIQRITRLQDAGQIAAIIRAGAQTPKSAHVPRIFIGSDHGFWVLESEFHTWTTYGGEYATPETLKVLRESQATSEGKPT